MKRKLPLLLFIAATGVAVFLAGMVAEASGSFWSRLARPVYNTLAANLGFASSRAEIGTVGDRSVSQHGALIPSADDAAPTVLIVPRTGGTASRTQCPGASGCLAVEYSAAGTVNRTWPFRPEEIANANIVDESAFPYEHALDWSFAHGLATFQLSPYPGGDLLVVFHFTGSNPYGGGVARVAPDGRPRWYRKDYSHHWPHVVGEDMALVPSMRVDRSDPECVDGVIEDQINVVGRDGVVLEEIPVLAAFAESPWKGRLKVDAHCDRIHLNFVHVLGADAEGAADIGAGDLVVSLWRQSAFVILDKDDRRMKRLVRGSFHRQHGVRHLEKARFVLLDSLGTDGSHGPSRLLIVDLASNKETTVFPNDATPEHLRDWLVFVDGQFDISADGRRALLAGVDDGRAVEIRLDDGEILNVFRHLPAPPNAAPSRPTLTEALRFSTLSHGAMSAHPHDVADTPWAFRSTGIYYANEWTP